MKFNFSSFSKSYDKERIPRKKIGFIIDYLEKENFKVLFFLNEKSFLPNSKKINLFKTENIDYSSLFSKNELLPFLRISKHFKSNLFQENQNPQVDALGYLVGIKLKSDHLGAFYLQHPKFKKEDIVNLLEYFKQLIQSFLDISELLSDNIESEILFQNLLEYLVFTMNASKGIILSKDPNSGIYDLKASLGIDDNLSKKIFRENKGALSLLKKSKESLIQKPNKDLNLLSYSEKNCVLGPFMSGKNLNGCIILYDKENRNGLIDFDQYDLRFFKSIVKKISLSYDNIILLENIKKSKKLIDNIMSSISTGIVKVNLIGEIEYINDSAIDIFKFKNENLLNNHYAMVFENNLNLVELIDFAESRSHILYEENLSILRTDSDETHINLTISPVFEDGINSGSVISFEDLSDINKVKSTFKKYVSENIVDELLLNDSSLELGGVEQDVCVLFSDIRGFTAMSETLEPSKVVKLLNAFFDKMIDVVFKYNGTLDKIIGDELMVLYGAPLKKKDDIKNAVNTAKEMFTTLDKFNKEMVADGFPELSIGIGINYGKVICGNIGSEQQMNYTVIGDTVNLASRLCSAANPGEIIISDSVHKELKEEHKFILSEDLVLKGKRKPVKNWKFTHSPL
jgi:adenylate cyclase